ncbi:hypothetical protein FB45DRAFT_767479, partial [Roridomyces roridus]
RRTPSTPTPLRTRLWAKNHPSVTTAPADPQTSETGSLSDSSPESVHLSNLASDSDSDSDSTMAPLATKPTFATITHPKSDRCPILEAGIITPEILYEWRRACQKYQKNCKERTADDLVSYVADEMREPILAKWYTASQTRIDGLKLDAYIAELGTLVLEKGWQGKMRCKVLGAKMALSGQTFADWAYDIQNTNAILSQAAATFALTDADLKNVLDAGLTETLQMDLDTEPVLSTELNAWIAEVKQRDDRLKFEALRMQQVIDSQPTKSPAKVKLSLAERLALPPKPSLASRLTTPPPKDPKAKCPPLTDGEKALWICMMAADAAASSTLVTAPSTAMETSQMQLPIGLLPRLMQKLKLLLVGRPSRQSVSQLLWFMLQRIFWIPTTKNQTLTVTGMSLLL